MPGTPPPGEEARHPAGRRRDEIVDAAPVALVFRIEGVGGLRRRPVGLLLVAEVRRGERMLVALFDRVPARARGRRSRDQAFDVGALGPREIRRDPAGSVGRANELHRSRLDLRLEAAVGDELGRVAVDVHVAVIRVGAKLHVGRVTDAAFEALRAGFDHRDVDRRVFGVRGLRIDLRLHAREVARGVESPHVPVQRRFAVRLAGLDRAEVLHDRCFVFPESRDLEPAETERRPAGELEHEIRAHALGVDRGFALHDARRRIRTAGEGGERAFLRDRPRGLPEPRALGQAPAAGERARRHPFRAARRSPPDRSPRCARMRCASAHRGPRSASP